MMSDRGLRISHTTIMRWVHEFGPEIDQRIRPFLKPTNDSWRTDETYIKVKGQWKYLYRAVDSMGKTIDFMLSENRDMPAAKRFFTLKGIEALHMIRKGQANDNSTVLTAVEWLNKIFGLVA
ncbi:hypothetical protein D3C73_557180 [compost metagenome]